MKSGALFYVHKDDGKRQDAALHEEILAGGDGKAEQVGIAVARRLGLTEEQIAQLYGSQVRDAQPRSLYVYRKLLNADALIAWAKDQGFKTTLPADDMHVTVMYSKSAFDWMKITDDMGSSDDGTLRIPPGGVRIVEQLDGGAVCLLFTSSRLSWRHEDIKRAGASYDYDQYQPHVTITYERGDVDPALVEPYQGELVLGPEVFQEIKE